MLRGVMGGMGISVSLRPLDLRRATIIGLTILLIYFAVGELILYYIIQKSDGILPIYAESNQTLPCYPSPYCRIDIKGLLMDLPNFYVHLPLSATLHELLNFKKTFWFISANFITFSHVIIAMLSAKCIANDSLNVRRLGVALFALRNFLDALDGTVARARRPPIDSFANVGTAGFYIDGLADGIGCVLLYVACLVYLSRHHPSPRGRNHLYSALPVTSLKEDKKIERELYGENESSWESTSCSTLDYFKIGNRICNWGPVSFSLQSLFCSVLWNRYIALYTKLLENPNMPPSRLAFQSHITKSNMMWMVIMSWRLFNVHSMVEMLLAAIYFDKMTEFFKYFKLGGWILILCSFILAEMHLNDIELYLNSRDPNSSIM